jgi:uncharacterized repeat protein (TIGR02543 family)
MKKTQLAAAAAVLITAFGFFACPQPTDNGSETPREEYSLSFDAAGGTFSDGNSLFIVKDTEQRIIGTDFPAEPQWVDHIFEGWFAGEAEDIEVTANTLLRPASENFTAYARWEELPPGHVPVSFYYNDGSRGLFVRKTAPAGGTLGDNFPAQNPMRVGYDFDGWYTEAEDGGEFTAVSVVNGATEVFAHWKTDDSGLKLHYLFDTSGSTVIDWRGNYNGTLAGGASVEDYSLYTGAGNGYVDMGQGPGSLLAQTENFTIAAYVNIDPAAALSGDGWFLWAFAAQPSVSNTAPCIWFRARDTQFTISKTGYSGESYIRTGNAMEKGIWQHIMYRQEGKSGIIYLNGIPAASGALNFQTTDLGTLSYNWIGRPCFDGDNYMTNTRYQDFRIYDRALDESQISGLDISGELRKLNAANESLIRQQLLAYAAEVEETFGDLDYLISDLSLPAGDGKGITVTWSSNDSAHLSDTGLVIRPGTGQSDAAVRLTGTFSKSGYNEEAVFAITIPALLNDGNAVALDKASLRVDGYMDYFYHEIVLPSAGPEGSAITWQSDSAAYPVDNGRVKVRDTADFDGSFTLTATISKGASSDAKTFPVTVHDRNYYGYLFAYFNGNAVSEEQLRFALSTDGLNFTALNNDQPVIDSPKIATTGGIRDPYVMRGPDGKFYMALTDMTSSAGWDSNRGLVLLKSDDLVSWQHSTVNVSTKYPNFSTITHAWAPEIVYDREQDKLMIHFSSNPGGIPNKVYYTYANADFTDLTDEPQILFPSYMTDVIDGNIAHVNGKYHMFYKLSNQIAKAEAPALTGPYTHTAAHVDNESTQAEGCETYRLSGTDTYVLIYDRYQLSPAQFGFRTSQDLVNFTTVTGSTQKADGSVFVPRHGSVIPLTKAEYDRLYDTDWLAASIPPVSEPAVLKLHYRFSEASGTSVANSAADYEGSYTGALQGGASLGATDSTGWFTTGSGNGYLDMGSGADEIITGQESFTIASYVFIENAAALSGNGWFLWCMADTEAASGSSGTYLFFRAISMRQCFSLAGWGNEANVSLGGNLPKGSWQHVMYRQIGSRGVIYINGKAAATTTVSIGTSELGDLSYNWLGRPCFTGDNYMKNTRYADFRMYSGAISDSQLAALDIAGTLETLNSAP